MKNPTARVGEQVVILGTRPRSRLGRLCHERSDHVLLVTDTRLETATPHVRETVEHLTNAHLDTHVLALSPEESGTLEAAREVHARMRGSGNRVCVALGGGSVIDTAKLARAAAHEPWLLDRAVWRRSSGLIHLRRPRTCDVPPHLIAVPTRPGTAAEVAARATITTGPTEARRLLTGETLRPTAALIDPDYGSTLSRSAWVDSLNEVLFRVLGPFLVTHRSSEEIDRVTAGWIEELAGLGTRTRESTPLSAEQRLRVSELSVSTATGAHVRLWEPAMPVWWCVQNTLVTRTGLTKGQLTARALPTLLELIAEGQDALGSADRLDALRRHTRVGTLERIGDLCNVVRESAEQHDRQRTEEELTEWGREVRELWGRHPGVASLGAKGIGALLHRIGF
ncbi:iron-containing alcohol dehydrogenase [Nocardiopsis sp. MG754419]|uniref:iron-containing alcohol dehydrogenase n=1 Tax=Nocardiopsis sp. MG754419 TaxID=2259865 RepID=UPI001BACBAC2|nr:iron-containing alcohol dehydrogenase [Nocardiopsis sp. MG754419]MBR8742627.1 hypothetical protein [Nocardiopsis sp. MG754419]